MALVRISVSLTLLLTLCGGCSHRTRPSPTEIRAQWKQAISYAAEAELFADIVRERRATAHFAEAHAKDLRDEIGKSVQQLSAMQQDGQAHEKVKQLVSRLTTLSQQITIVGASTGDDAALSTAQDRITRIRQELEQADR